MRSLHQWDFSVLWDNYQKATNTEGTEILKDAKTVTGKYIIE